MSKKLVVAHRPERWVASISCIRRAAASSAETPGREPAWWTETRPLRCAVAERRDWTSFSRILLKVSRRTITRKERGVELSVLPDFGRTKPFDDFRQEGWKPNRRQIDMISGMSAGVAS